MIISWLEEVPVGLMLIIPGIVLRRLLLLLFLIT